jgi:hypothetical protein
MLSSSLYWVSQAETTPLDALIEALGATARLASRAAKYHDSQRSNHDRQASVLAVRVPAQHRYFDRDRAHISSFCLLHKTRFNLPKQYSTNSTYDELQVSRSNTFFLV